MKRFGFPIVAGMVLSLAACGDRAPEETAAPAAATPESSATPHVVTAPEAAPAPQVEAAQPRPENVPKLTREDLVAPPTAGKPGAPIEIKYELASSPAVGQPLVIDFALAPKRASSAVRVMVASSTGLTLRQSTAPAVVRNVEAGSEYWYQVVVTPEDTGVFNVNIIATVGEGEQMLARTLSIPVVVGSASMDDAKARKLNVPVDATGQAIEVMPGQESR